MFLLRLMIVALLFPTNARLPQFQSLCLRAFASKNVAFAPVCPHHLHRIVRLNARLETFDWSHQERRSMHPKEALVNDGIVNKAIARAVIQDAAYRPKDTPLLLGGASASQAKGAGIEVVYPNCCSLHVQEPADSQHFLSHGCFRKKQV
jgi:hypothetical protein